MVLDTVLIVGIGLIGSSLSRAIKRHGLAGRVVCLEVDPDHRTDALRYAQVDAATDDPAIAAEADLVVICTPVGTYESVARAIAPHLRPGAIVSDVGSVKQATIRDLGPHMPQGVHLVPGHPIAGTEESGPKSGFASLFEGRWLILTPPPGTDEAAVETVAALWRGCGSMVEVMEPGHHDRVLAITSHLPHLIAFTVVGTATDLEEHLQQEVVRYSASGFRDFTRIAASDPVMWRDIFLNNREAVLDITQRFVEDLTALQRAIRWGETETLEKHFTRARGIRRGVVEAGQHVPPAPRTPRPE